MRSAFKLKRKYNGSLTVETALVLPIFMLLAVALISILEMMNTYSKVEYALHETAREAAIMSYAVDKCLPVELLEENDLSAEIADFTLSETVIRALLIEKLSEDESATALIEGGNLGLRLWRSDVVNDENCIDIIVTYKVSPWINLFDIGSLTLVNRAKVHKWNGYSHTEEDDEYVYITAQGEVYHTNPNCPYLHVSIQSVNLSNIESYRNKDGSKYKPCKTCFDSSNGNIVYITEYGEAYHSSIDCGGIKRTVYKVKLSETGGRPLCDKCSHYKRGEDNR